jgi:E3 ubiquitin-protein ligase BOI-like protein
MAVQARHYSHNLAPAAGGSLFLDEYAGCAPAPAGRIGDATTVLSDFPRSELAFAWCNYGFLPRKRPRLEAADQAVAPAAGGHLLEDQHASTPPACTERLLPVPPFVGVRSRAVGSGAASTSGRVANGATTVVLRELLSSWTHHHGVEIDALVALEVRTALFDRGFNLSIGE